MDIRCIEEKTFDMLKEDFFSFSDKVKSLCEKHRESEVEKLLTDNYIKTWRG